METTLVTVTGIKRFNRFAKHCVSKLCKLELIYNGYKDDYLIRLTTADDELLNKFKSINN